MYKYSEWEKTNKEYEIKLEELYLKWDKRYHEKGIIKSITRGYDLRVIEETASYIGKLRNYAIIEASAEELKSKGDAMS